MKVIDLLNKIANGDIPKKIKYDNDIWEYIEEKGNYIKSNGASLNWDYVAIYCLNETVEILEEPKGIPEKINNGYYHLEQGEQNQLFKNKLNEIIDYLESKGE